MRVAVVNDVPMAVEAMRRVIRGTREHHVAWIAHDGAQAVALCARDRPDLLLMDLMMPVMDGVEATRRIMARTPCPIVVVTANVDDHSSKVFEALGAGALDAVNTPILDHPESPLGAQALLAKVATIEALLHGRPRSRTPHGAKLGRARPASVRGKLVALGASAGGPAALAAVLSTLPREFAAAILVVQHLDAHFVEGFSGWLQSQCRIPVRLAEQGDRPESGVAFIAGRDQHLLLGESGRLGYSRIPEEASYRPSVDQLLSSVSRHWTGEAAGVLLTGMGRDGAIGLLEMRRRGWLTVAQNEATSAVYGMPKAAVEIQAASEILPLEKIAPRLLEWVAQTAQLHV